MSAQHIKLAVHSSLQRGDDASGMYHTDVRAITFSGRIEVYSLCLRLQKESREVGLGRSLRRATPFILLQNGYPLDGQPSRSSRSRHHGQKRRCGRSNTGE